MECQSLTRHTGESSKVQWYNLMQDYFGVSLDASSARRWWDEIAQTVPEVNNILLCNAIKWASEPSSDQQGESFAKPTLIDLIRWVRCYKAKQCAPVKVACDICNSTGWCDYYHGWKTDWKIEQYMAACVTKVPCLCVNKDAQTSNMALTMRESFKAELRKS